ncbi:MAG: AAA family ATPase, partial [Acidimicrobiia bacterium]
LAGFKSFADRTRLEFEPGVTVVAGPNGAGKSNLVEAVAWVMGTQATSALRSERMEDVIFAGTATRPSRSRAEVALTFDNSAGLLPLDLTTVTIARRLYRDGTSEYEINGTRCRLLDIQELLSDSGVGRHQHVIVGQGRVEAILTAGPNEHRAVIEEAAGVTKHRHRRDRSVRRLEQTGSDVERLRDLLREQQRLMRPLKRQAKATERHEDLRSEWRALRLAVGGEELRSIRHRRRLASEAEATLSRELAGASKELEALSASASELQAAAGDRGRALDRDTTAAARLETAAERLQRLAMVAAERRSGLQGRLEGSGQRRRDLEDELADLRGGIASSAMEQQDVEAQLARRETELRALEDEERLLAEQDRLPSEGVAATLRGDLAALEMAAKRDSREVESIADRQRVVGSRLRDEIEETERLQREIRQTAARLGPAQTVYQAAREAAQREQSALESSEGSLQEARVQLERANARLEALESASAGLGDPEARRRVEASDDVVGALTAHLAVPGRFAAAVDAALGPWCDALVAVDTDAVVEVFGALKSDGLGGVPLVASLGAGLETKAQIVAAEWELVALMDLLGPEADVGLAGVLLGDVVLVEGWSTAWQLVRRHPELRAV